MNNPKEDEVLENLINLAENESIEVDEGLDETGEPKPKPTPPGKPPQ